VIYEAVRRVGFLLDPEVAHRMALVAARVGRPLSTARARRHRSHPVTAFGLSFRNPLGLAAGYDKDGTAWRGLAAVGFGHVEIGTVTPRPQRGNPRPRLERIPDRRALVNRLGFPSDGAQVVARRLSRHRQRKVILGVSIGPNADTPPSRRLDDYLVLIDTFAPLADYLAINVSSPNTAGLRDLERPDALAALLRDIVVRRDEAARRLGRAVPLLVKLSPDSEAPGALGAVAADAGADGLIVGNTTTARDGMTAGLPVGGLSGEPLGPLAARRLDEVIAGAGLPVIACGGVMTADDVDQRLAAGAILVQIYTGLVYRGPRLVHEVLDG
jgi:dihydroorotate dehydrogenase